jgi:hypothetical protein
MNDENYYVNNTNAKLISPTHDYLSVAHSYPSACQLQNTKVVNIVYTVGQLQNHHKTVKIAPTISLYSAVLKDLS